VPCGWCAGSAPARSPGRSWSPSDDGRAVTLARRRSRRTGSPNRCRPRLICPTGSTRSDRITCCTPRGTTRLKKAGTDLGPRDLVDLAAVAGPDGVTKLCPRRAGRPGVCWRLLLLTAPGWRPAGLRGARAAVRPVQVPVGRVQRSPRAPRWFISALRGGRAGRSPPGRRCAAVGTPRRPSTTRPDWPGAAWPYDELDEGLAFAGGGAQPWPVIA